MLCCPLSARKAGHTLASHRDCWVNTVTDQRSRLAGSLASPWHSLCAVAIEREARPPAKQRESRLPQMVFSIFNSKSRNKASPTGLFPKLRNSCNSCAENKSRARTHGYPLFWFTDISSSSLRGCLNYLFSLLSLTLRPPRFPPYFFFSFLSLNDKNLS